MGKSTISMAIFNSKLLVYQRESIHYYPIKKALFMDTNHHISHWNFIQ